MRRGRDARGRAGRQAAWFRVTAAASSATLLGTLGLAGTSMAATGAAASAAKPGAATAGTSCHLGNGVKHVVTLVFDNVHYFRDNPNVPSDLELMPNLLNFFEQNGTMMSNNHTPLIAHTADDILTTLTGIPVIMLTLPDISMADRMAEPLRTLAGARGRYFEATT